MRRFLLVLIFVFPFLISNAQKITAANFVLSKQGKGFRTIQLLLDDKIEVVVTGAGRIKYIGTTDGYPIENMDQMGPRVEYYTDFDIHDEKGKLKSIGNLVFKYNNAFDIHDVKGTLKSVGDINITYYNTFDIHDPQGRVKSVGNVQVKYYNKFDINDRFGDIKSISGNTDELSVTTRPILFRQ